MPYVLIIKVCAPLHAFFVCLGMRLTKRPAADARPSTRAIVDFCFNRILFADANPPRGSYLSLPRRPLCARPPSVTSSFSPRVSGIFSVSHCTRGPCLIHPRRSHSRSARSLRVALRIQQHPIDDMQDAVREQDVRVDDAHRRRAAAHVVPHRIQHEAPGSAT